MDRRSISDFLEFCGWHHPDRLPVSHTSRHGSLSLQLRYYRRTKAGAVDARICDGVSSVCGMVRTQLSFEILQVREHMAGHPSSGPARQRQVLLPMPCR